MTPLVSGVPRRKRSDREWTTAEGYSSIRPGVRGSHSRFRGVVAGERKGRRSRPSEKGRKSGERRENPRKGRLRSAKVPARDGGRGSGRTNAALRLERARSLRFCRSASSESQTSYPDRALFSSRGQPTESKILGTSASSKTKLPISGSERIPQPSVHRPGGVASKPALSCETMYGTLHHPAHSISPGESFGPLGPILGRYSSMPRTIATSYR